MMWWTGLAPWEFEFSFPGSLTSTFLLQEDQEEAEFMAEMEREKREARLAEEKANATSVPEPQNPKTSNPKTPKLQTS